MAFCKFSSEYTDKFYTMVDNAFFAYYFPSVEPKVSGIYLYGLYLCSIEGQRETNTNIETFAKKLGYEAKEVIQAFEYWEEQGLVRIVSTAPFEIKYLPVREASRYNKAYSKDKYATFNQIVRETITGRDVQPHELSMFYDLVEGDALPDGRRFEIEAVLMLIKYCVQLRGPSVHSNYFLTVARAWASEGCVTVEQIEEKLAAYSTQSQEVAKICKALGSSKKLGVEEHELYNKWTMEFGFLPSVIEYVAKNMKKATGATSFEKLDKKLQKYYEAHLLDITEIATFEANKDSLYALAREINRILGLYYNDLSNEVETYIQPWLTIGFAAETILDVAQDCYKRSKRTLAQLAEEIEYLYERGIVSMSAYSAYINKNKETKSEIAEILKKLGVERNVTSIDIDYYNRWINTWGLGKEIISVAVDFAAKRGANITYVNTTLADWHTKGIRTLTEAQEELKKFSEPATTNKTSKSSKPDSKINKRSYTDSEQASLFDNFTEIEI